MSASKRRTKSLSILVFRIELNIKLLLSIFTLTIPLAGYTNLNSAQRGCVNLRNTPVYVGQQSHPLEHLLEKEYNWKGICVEALPDKFNELVKNRTSININKAVYDTTGIILDFSSNDLLSGVTKNIDKHKNSLDKPVIKVETITLNDILEQNNAPNFIDYLTLDTEGSELIILNSVNFDKYKFGLIHLEHNYVEPRRTDMKNLLISKGYKYIGENQWDDEYSYEEK